MEKNTDIMNDDIFVKTYKLLNKCTPLPVDCGQLCDGACCKGDEDNGMLLFPGEEQLFLDNQSFEIRATDYVLDDGFVVKLLLCKSPCNRKFRPLGCRIFPLIGFAADGEIEVQMDPRSNDVCPLAIVGIQEGISTQFILKVKKVFEILMGDARCKNFIEIMTEQLDFGGFENG